MHNVTVCLMETDVALNLMPVPPEYFLLVIHGEFPSASSTETTTTTLKNRNVDRHKNKTDRHKNKGNRHKRNAEGKQMNEHYVNRKQNGQYTTKMNDMSNEEKFLFKNKEN